MGNWLIATGLLMTVSAVILPARADDPGIPAVCRPAAAIDNPRCADIIDALFKNRNLHLNSRDKQANAELRQQILASTTLTGETIGDVLDYARQHIPFAVQAWHFIYARSGAEYAVLEYGDKPGITGALSKELDSLSLFDDDREVEPVSSLCNSRADGYVVWKVAGKSFAPCGAYANMIVLGPQAFVWAVNDGRKGFSDSGYDTSIEQDFSFLSKLPAGNGKLSDYARPDASQGATMYWNVVDGYVVEAGNLNCPPKKVGSFLVRAPDCEARAAAVRDVSGNVLPFTIVRADRSHGYVDGMVGALVSVMVDGGEPADWITTAVYIAEHSIVRDTTFVTAEVYVTNPWSDFPPQHFKLLAKVYYAPDPSRSPWKERWSISGATHAGTLADIEYDKLSNDLIDDPDKTPDPNVRWAKAEAAARKAVIRKYSLSKDWKPTENLGLDGQNHDRDHVRTKNAEGISASMDALNACLTTSRGFGLLQGCMPQRP